MHPPLRPPTRAWPWAALGGLLGALWALAVLAPAAWLAQALEGASQGRVQLRAAQGSIWGGSAQLVLTAGARASDAQALPGAVHWRIRPQWDSAGPALVLQLSADCCTPAPLSLLWRASATGGQLVLADGQSRWPAEVLTGLGQATVWLKPTKGGADGWRDDSFGLALAVHPAGSGVLRWRATALTSASICREFPWALLPAICHTQPLPGPAQGAAQCVNSMPHAVGSVVSNDGPQPLRCGPGSVFLPQWPAKCKPATAAALQRLLAQCT